MEKISQEKDINLKMFKNKFYYDYDMRVKERLQLHKKRNELYSEVNQFQFSESGCLFHNISELAEFTDVNDDHNDHYENINFFAKDNAV